MIYLWEMLDKKRIKAQKSFGQNFLKDTAVLAKIYGAVKEANIHSLDLIEIGPGMGALTDFLIQLDQNIICVEVDKRCVDFLTNKYQHKINDGQLKIMEKDFLKIKLNDFLTQDTLIVGNFPYNISSQIIFSILESYTKVPTMIGMFQKEMAARVAATHGSKTYGIISVLTQLHYNVSFLFEVPPTSFVPVPKVDSAVIKLERKQQIDTNFSYSLFKHIVKTSFNQRRKMLRSTLKGIVPTENLKDDFFNLRPEQLSVEDFIALTKKVEAYQ